MYVSSHSSNCATFFKRSKRALKCFEKKNKALEHFAKEISLRLTAHSWQNHNVHSSHVLAMKFIA